MKTDIQLDDFLLPDHVTGSLDSGGSVSIPITSVPVVELSNLCDRFRKNMFIMVGRQDPQEDKYEDRIGITSKTG